jgi:hypothetical protein
MSEYKTLPSEPIEQMTAKVTWQTASEVVPIISLELHNTLVSRLASEVYTVIGALYATDEKLPDSVYEEILDKLMDIINNPEILQSSENLLIPL